MGSAPGLVNQARVSECERVPAGRHLPAPLLHYRLSIQARLPVRGKATHDGTAAGTATLAITSSAGGGCAQANQTHRRLPWYAGGISLACVLCFGFPMYRGRLRQVGMMLLLATLTTAGGMGCGSGRTSNCDAFVADTTPGT